MAGVPGGQLDSGNNRACAPIWWLDHASGYWRYEVVTSPWIPMWVDQMGPIQNPQNTREACFIFCCLGARGSRGRVSWKWGSNPTCIQSTREAQLNDLWNFISNHEHIYWLAWNKETFSLARHRSEYTTISPAPFGYSMSESLWRTAELYSALKQPEWAGTGAEPHSLLQISCRINGDFHRRGFGFLPLIGAKQLPGILHNWCWKSCQKNKKSKALYYLFNPK